MRKIILATLLATMLAACGQAAQTPTTSGGATAPPSSPAPATAAPEPTAAPAAPEPTSAPAPTGPASGGVSVRPPDDLVAAAQRLLATHLNLQPDQLVLQSANRQEWPDGGLGCPAEGMVYPQVITEGFMLVFTDAAQAQSYEVHTASTPAQLVLCQNGQPIDLSASNAAGAQPGATEPAGDAAQQMMDLARAALAQELNVKPEDITVASVAQQDWSDSSLGCPKEGEAYLQVITPGYLVTLEAQGQRYEYHTDSTQRVVRC